MKAETIKKAIKKSYGVIAKDELQGGCCGTEPGCCGTNGLSTAMTQEYPEIAGYYKEADLSLGCGLPTEIANISEGDTVIDLGSGAGNDAFIARSIVGEHGKVIGIDMTPEMVIKALRNNQRLGFQNVDFLLGEIEDMQQVQNNTANVVISNCVMNLVPDKEKAFREVFRVLKTGGHFSISDIVFTGALPKSILEAAELYAGCVAGASEKGTYLGIIKSVGFKNISIKSERKIDIPDDFLLKYVDSRELKVFKESGSDIYSVTIYAEKLDEGNCCDPSDGECCGSEVNKETEKTTCCATVTDEENGCC